VNWAPGGFQAEREDLPCLLAVTAVKGEKQQFADRLLRVVLPSEVEGTAGSKKQMSSQASDSQYNRISGILKVQPPWGPHVTLATTSCSLPGAAFSRKLASVPRASVLASLCSSVALIDAKEIPYRFRIRLAGGRI
jgi:hypothetical protein